MTVLAMADYQTMNKRAQEDSFIFLGEYEWPKCGRKLIWMSKGKSCLTSLITFYDQMTGSVQERRIVDVVYIDFSKTFGIISHSIFPA